MGRVHFVHFSVASQVLVFLGIPAESIDKITSYAIDARGILPQNIPMKDISNIEERAFRVSISETFKLSADSALRSSVVRRRAIDDKTARHS